MDYIKSKKIIEYEIIINYQKSILKTYDKAWAKVVLKSLLDSKKYHNVFMVKHITIHYAKLGGLL